MINPAGCDIYVVVSPSAALLLPEKNSFISAGCSFFACYVALADTLQLSVSGGKVCAFGNRLDRGRSLEVFKGTSWLIPAFTRF